MKRRTIHPLLALTLLLAAIALQAQEPAFLAVDLAPGTLNGDAFPSGYDPLPVGFRPVELGDSFYFAADHPLFGVELWISDGTPEGTRLVVDFCPGPCDSRPGGLRAVGGRLFFSAEHPVLGRELFVLRPGGKPTLIADLCPGVCSALAPEGDFFEFQAVELGHRLVFTADDGLAGVELWITDGTPRGTRRLADLCPGSCGSHFTHLLAAGDRVFFQVHPPPFYNQVVGSSDGTPAGTRLLRRARDPVRVGEEVFMISFEEGTGEEVWRSDGTAAGTELIADLCPRDCSGVNLMLGVFEGRLYFQGRQRPIPDFRLYRTDGTPTGSELVSPVVPQSDLAAVLGHELFFFGRELIGEPFSLWASNGTRAGTRPVAAVPFPSALLVTSERLFFHAGQELWTSDGSAAGTRVVKLGAGHFLEAAVLGDRFFFAAEDNETGREMWTSDGTLEGTLLFADLNRGHDSSRPRRFVRLDGAAGERMVFVTGGPGTGDDEPKLWSLDGRASELLGIDSFVLEPDEFFPTADGELLYCPPALPARGLRSTDGTPGGTRTRAAGIFDCRSFSAFDDGFLFAASAAEDFVGEELYVTDLTPDGTRLVKNIEVGSGGIILPEEGSSRPRLGAELEGKMLLSAFRGSDGRELWRSDGTRAGTNRIRDIHPRGSSDPTGLTRIGDLVVFAAFDDVRGRELFASDGTRAGTRRVLDLNRGRHDSNPRHFLALDGELYFFARRGRSDRLWRTDGTRIGTRHVKNLAVAGQPSTVGEAVATADRLFFTVHNRRTGTELWTSDGTARGTRQITEIAPGRRGAVPVGLVALDRRVLFAAEDGVHGREPWISDGSAAGTRMLADVEPGPASSGAAEFTWIGDFLYFRATNAANGTELWAVPAGTALKAISNSNFSKEMEP